MKYSLNQLHDQFLLMLREFDQFCREYGLRYFLDGGTLLGAVRDGGFIPWDDDVDIVMPRPDYNRLIAEWDGTLRLFCHENDRHFLFPYIKLFHPTMPIVEIEDASFGVSTTVFMKIDLYPMDGMPSSPRSALRHARRVRRWKQLLFLNQEREKSKNLIKRLVYGLISALPAEYIYSSLDRTMRKYQYENFARVTRWRVSRGEVTWFDKKDIEPLSSIRFEGTDFFCPANSDYYLRQTYGDYKNPSRQNQGLRHSTDASVLAKGLAKYFRAL